MFRKINICDIFILIWGLYYLQDLLYPQGFINQMLQLLMISLGLISFCQCLLSRSNPDLIRATILLVLMYTVYGSIILVVGDNISSTVDSTYLKASYNSLLPIIFFYQQAKKHRLTTRKLKIYFFVITVIAIIHFVQVDKMTMLLLDSEENTNNVSYMFVSLLPFVFLFNKKPVVQYIIIAILMLYILLGMKRGAILIGAIIALLFIYSSLKHQRPTKKIVIMLFASILVGGLIVYVGHMMNTSDYFANRVQQTIDGNSSGRDKIYSAIWSAVISEPNILKFIFGHGANSSINYAGNFAHNDWLETLCNNGLIGLSILLYYFVAFWRLLINGRRSLSEAYYYCLIALFLISFLMTIFSMSIQALDMYQGMLIGFLSYHAGLAKI